MVAVVPLCIIIFVAIGNHCLFAGRDELEARLGLKGAPYYTKDVSESWRLIVLDTVDMSLFRDEGDPLRAEAIAFLAEHSSDENALPYNGGLGAAQREWFVEQLGIARSDGKRVIVCAHHPAFEDAAQPKHLMWGHVWMQATLKEYNDVVACYFSGHFHDGGYAELDRVHHVTFQAILDSDETNVCNTPSLAIFFCPLRRQLI